MIIIIEKIDPIFVKNARDFDFVDRIFLSSDCIEILYEILRTQLYKLTRAQNYYCDVLKPWGPYTQIPCCEKPKSGGPGVRLTTLQLTEYLWFPFYIYIFSYKYKNSYNILQEFDVQLFDTFTCQNI